MILEIPEKASFDREDLEKIKEIITAPKNYSKKQEEMFRAAIKKISELARSVGLEGRIQGQLALTILEHVLSMVEMGLVKGTQVRFKDSLATVQGMTAYGFVQIRLHELEAVRQVPAKSLTKP